MVTSQVETKKVTKSYLNKPESKHRGNHKAQNDRKISFL